MNTSFWFGYKLRGFLFPALDIETHLGFVAACFGVATFVIVFESLKTARAIRKLKNSTLDRKSLFKLAFSSTSEKSHLIEQSQSSRETWNISDILFHICELVIGYMLMLIAMTYNAYIMISICIGAGIAYLAVGSVLLNVTANLVVHKLCAGCQGNPDGSSTPVIETVDENTPSCSSNAIHKSEAASDDITTTDVQVHV